MKKQLLTFLALLITGIISAQVGIGTTTPSQALDVETNEAGGTAIDINNTGTGDPKINLQLNGTTTFSIGVDNDDADKLKIGTTAPETNTRVTIDNTGNVGVGTSTPGAKLDVDGSAIFNESGAAVDFRVESDGYQYILLVDGSANAVGVNTATPASTLDVQGSLGYKVNTITAATTLNQTHNVVLCNTGPYTVTLPAAATNSGKVYYIKNIDTDGDDITIDANASETIDGDLTFRLDPYKHAVRLICDGTNWHVIEESGNNTQNSQSSFTVVNCNGSIFSWSNVTNATTGKVWMDRNLGASQVATSSTDANSYGDLYQWGRAKDGHQCRTSSTTATLSKDNTPTHGDFITSAGNWRSSQNDNLWQGVSGINNPCPSGYRLPTEAELEDERISWSSNNAAGAFASVLKLPLAGERINSTGVLNWVGVNGQYWTSTVNGTSSRWLTFNGGSSSIGNAVRAFSLSVRCIKN